MAMTLSRFPNYFEALSNDLGRSHLELASTAQPWWSWPGTDTWNQPTSDGLQPNY